jgi:ABC-type transport system involved in multi-copper enzyme maturation permease subunit
MTADTASSVAAAPTERQGRDGFTRLLRAEWTKFRTVRGWVAGALVAGLAIVGLGLGPSMAGSCGKHGPESACVPLVGPEGEEVADNFYFVRQPLSGDGAITVRVTSLTGLLPATPTSRTGAVGTRPGLAPWAKAGVIIKASTKEGSAYAAVLVTGGHGVRMQYNYTHDTAGSPGLVSAAAPRWLRLERAGDSVTGYESADGASWTKLGSAHLEGLPSTVEAGLLATSPQYSEAIRSLGMQGAAGGPTQATASFDHLALEGGPPSPAWTGEDIGGPSNATAFQRGGYRRVGDGFQVTGSGDVAPAVAGAAGIGTTISQTLVGTFIGLIVMVVIGAMFIAAEYRRGLIRTTVAASPRRGRILAAKAIVIAAVSSLTGLAAAATVVTLGQRTLRANGVYVHPASALTEVRVVAGTAALLAVSSVLALAIGSLLRRGAAAVTAVVVVIVLPYLLAVSVLPAGAADWLLRTTPAAAFAVQQATPRYFQVDNLYTPATGFFPLGPWTGFAVLCAWTVVAMGAAVLVFRRRDA